jgi:hypothetical protein
MPHRVLCIAFLITGLAAGLSAQTHPEQSIGSVNFVDQYIDIESMGVPPERLPVGSSAAYADARRAAYVLAGRNLAEILAGLYIESSTSLADAGAHEFSDKVKADLMRTRIPGGKVIEESSMEDFKRDNQVRMTVRYPLSAAIPELMRAMGPHLREVEKSLPAAPPPAVPAMNKAAYDGLIVSVPEGFQPTIAPKIFNSKGQLVYGANSVSMDVLVSQGVAQFTNQLGKARAGLEAHGAREILTVSGTLHGGNKDIDIDDADASKILGANAQTDFLAKGRVVFVVGGGI